jgi:hypothetical protein
MCFKALPGVLSLRLKRPGRDADQSAHIVATFKMHGPTSALSFMSSFRTQERFYVAFMRHGKHNYA